MTPNAIDFVVLSEDTSIKRLNPMRILVQCRELRKDFEEQGFKTNIEAIGLLSELIDKAEDAALVSILDRD